MNTATSSISISKCLHCGNLIGSGSQSEFCCQGCKLIYSLLQERGLDHYYDLKAKTKTLRKAVPVQDLSTDYTYLDTPEALKLYSFEDPHSPGDRWMEFYLEGVHCAACVWLTEKVSEFVDHVRTIRLNLGNSIATVKISEGGSFSEVAQEFLRMGYRPHPVQRGTVESLQKKEARLLLIQLGVAATCAGNIMLLAISVYGGATGELGHHFQWISFFLFLPVIVFSAFPFYKSAFTSLRLRQSSIDIPIVFGLLLGTLASIFNLFTGSDQVYFDSLSTLIFLLLATRYLLKRTQQSTLASSHLAHFLIPSTAHRWNSKSQSFEQVLLDQLQPGDQVQVKPGECIPADGFIIEGKSSLNNGLLTGESIPILANPGQFVFAGTLNLFSPLTIQITHSGVSTRLGEILKSLEAMMEKKAPTVAFADRVSRIFVLFVVGVSGLLFLWGLQKNWHEGINRALALAIATCPCTFALATPLAFSLTLGRLAKAGILVRGADTIEKLTHLRSVYLDKTGTLTYGNFEVLKWESHEPEMQRIETENAVLAIESNSNHPIAKSLVRYLQKRSDPFLPVSQFKEKFGIGVFGTVNHQIYEISQAPLSKEGTEIQVKKNGENVGHFILGDQVRPEAREVIEDFRKLGLRPWIVSGDSRAATTQLAQQVGIPLLSCIAEATPEKKAELISEDPQSLMVGDGANDSLALASAQVSVAVNSSVEVSMRAADIYLSNPGIKPIHQLIGIARETLKVVHRNFFFSLFYNAAATTAAVLGKINPLFAAVLMPISALIVFLSSIAGTHRMRKIFKEMNT